MANKKYTVDVTGIIASLSLLIAGCVLVALNAKDLGELVIGAAIGGAALPTAYRTHQPEGAQ